jgi:SAM-dependent methyltransferase
LIGRFDEYLLNLRRYGFTLATIMIGADAYFVGSDDMPSWVKAGAVIVVMMLIFALFLLDEHIKILQGAAVERASKIESNLGLNLSVSLQRTNKARVVRHSGTLTYLFFLAAACTIGTVSVITTTLQEGESSVIYCYIPLASVIVVFLALFVLTPYYDWSTRRVVGDQLHPTRAMRREAVDWLRIGDGMKILEIGPVLDTFTIEASKRVGESGKVFAIDKKSAIISNLNRSLWRENIVNVTTEVAPDYKIPFTDISFDRVFMFGIFGKTPDRGQALLQINRVLDDIGLLAIGESWIDPDDLRDRHFLGRKTIIRECENAGFELVGEWGNPPLRYLLAFKKLRAEDIRCPICGSATAVRTAKKGPNAGLPFIVCARYPECKGKIPI